MRRIRSWTLTAALGASLSFAPWAQSQPPIRIKVGTPPRPEPLAETRLLMNGLTQPNFRSLGKLLKDQPKEAEAWTFARGQALLLGETANLLLMRPPKTSSDAEDVWLTRAADMREAATGLAKAAAGQDYPKSRAGLVDVANACNRCHQSFRVATRVAPFSE